jgi:hypothetical protein
LGAEGALGLSTALRMRPSPHGGGRGKPEAGRQAVRQADRQDDLS